MRVGNDPKSHNETKQKLEKLRERMEEKSWTRVQNVSTPLKMKPKKTEKTLVLYYRESERQGLPRVSISQNEDLQDYNDEGEGPQEQGKHPEKERKNLRENGS